MIGFLLSGTVIRSQLGEIGVVHGKTMKQLRAMFKLLNDFLNANTIHMFGNGLDFILWRIWLRTRIR